MSTPCAINLTVKKLRPTVNPLFCYILQIEFICKVFNKIKENGLLDVLVIH